ncbi:uncharacterized skeletal organic matrix protein 5-like [Stylophora pistillata]|uniref:uncharacterized skeletal organic matrix protein 5-like n=1 Tax=Stylophora pistillata TaxID=50429 RepID=UPI000C054E14|nr:uncharacterized skeletal organic matrix protein 5-like [Stylophora pistillata]
MVKKGNETPSGTIDHREKMLDCNCNLNRDSSASKAIKTCSTSLLLQETGRSRRSQVYPLLFGSKEIPIFCHMRKFRCGGGEWTLTMKIDGTKRTFHYDSHFWSYRNSLDLLRAKTGFDLQETKLATYWNTYFSKVCLGIRIGHQNRFMIINRHANSLYSLIAVGKYHATSLGRYTWRRLIGPDASLQRNCDMEGFNAKVNTGNSKARIGIIANNDNDCNSCNSRIGFGTGLKHLIGFGTEGRNTCGNEAMYSPDNGEKHIRTMGYILVQ